MRALSLFSGIGGFDLAAEWCGFEVSGMVEKDKFCQKVLKKHWPNVILLEDIHDVKGNEFGTIDIIYGGPPCQPASCAGKRRGKEDDRWLWKETFRVIAEVKPKWVILENVRGLLSLESGVVFDNLLSELENLGYETRTFCLPACAVNAPHRRDRVWIIANSNRPQNDTTKNINGWEESITDNRKGIRNIVTANSRTEDSHAPDTLNEGCIRRSSGSDSNINGIQEGEQTGSEPRSATSRCDEIPLTDTKGGESGEQTKSEGWKNPCRGNKQDVSNSAVSIGDKYVADTGFKNSRCKRLEESEIFNTDKLSRPNSIQQEGQGCWSENWLEVASRLCVMDDELSSGLVGYLGITEEHLKRRDEHRVQKLKALGNAIVPSVAYEIMKAIMDVNNDQA